MCGVHAWERFIPDIARWPRSWGDMFVASIAGGSYRPSSNHRSQVTWTAALHHEVTSHLINYYVIQRCCYNCIPSNEVYKIAVSGEGFGRRRSWHSQGIDLIFTSTDWRNTTENLRNSNWDPPDYEFITISTSYWLPWRLNFINYYNVWCPARNLSVGFTGRERWKDSFPSYSVLSLTKLVLPLWSRTIYFSPYLRDYCMLAIVVGGGGSFPYTFMSVFMGVLNSLESLLKLFVCSSICDGALTRESIKRLSRNIILRIFAKIRQLFPILTKLE